MNRNIFIRSSAIAGASMILTPLETLAGKVVVDPYPVNVVKEFVIAGHGNLDKVKELLQHYPNLIYSKYDWTNGDCEEAIEGAAHVGNKEITKWLMEHGARPNLFIMTMLGEIAIVKSIIEKYPVLLQTKGAHGLTLLHHAVKGGDEAKELADYFREKGLTEMQSKIK